MLACSFRLSTIPDFSFSLGSNRKAAPLERRSYVTVAPARARELALSLPSVNEAPHFDGIAFRTPRKILATLSATRSDLNLMFDPDLREFFCEQAPCIRAGSRGLGP
jgi:hypothetical protein